MKSYRDSLFKYLKQIPSIFYKDKEFDHLNYTPQPRLIKSRKHLGDHRKEKLLISRHEYITASVIVDYQPCSAKDVLFYDNNPCNLLEPKTLSHSEAQESRMNIIKSYYEYQEVESEFIDEDVQLFK